MLSNLSFVILIFVGQFALAHSAKREPGVSYLAYKAQAQLMAERQPMGRVSTPVDESESYDKATLPAATAWPSEAALLERFQKMRDYRFLRLDSRPDFLRRSSWLYPDDGCFARAALAVLNLGKWSYELPNKIFVFGDLRVKTANAPGGEVTWWYHVAPLVEVNGEKYVLDPAISPRTPLKLLDWLSTMSDKPEELEVAVCGSGSYIPYDACHKESDGVESTAEQEQKQYLRNEWDRIRSLGRNPEQELGDLPPWLGMSIL